MTLTGMAPRDVRDVCLQLGVTDATCYLKRAVADLTLDKHVLMETIRKNR